MQKRMENGQNPDDRRAAGEGTRVQSAAPARDCRESLPGENSPAPTLKTPARDFKLRTASVESRMAELDDIQRSMVETEDINYEERRFKQAEARKFEVKSESASTSHECSFQQRDSAASVVEKRDSTERLSPVQVGSQQGSFTNSDRHGIDRLSAHEWTFEEQFKQLYDLGSEHGRREFLDDLFTFMQKRGTPVNRVPIMAKQTLDLYKLFRLVVEKGGLVEVINKKIWREIIKGLSLPASVTSAAFTLRTQYMKYLYPYECAKKKLSTPAELQAAIDGNRRDSRRTFGPFGSPGGSLSDSTHIFGSSTSPPASSSSFVVNHSPGATSRPSPGPSPTSDEVMVPPSVHGNNGVAMLHSPSLIHRTNPEYSNKRSASTSSDTARSVSSPNTSPSHSPVKKFAVATEQERERDPERGYRPQGQVPQWTHIKIQTQSKAMMMNNQSTHQDSGSSRESRQLPLTLLDQVSDNSLLVSVELNGIVYQGVLFARQGQGQTEGQRH